MSEGSGARSWWDPAPVPEPVGADVGHHQAADAAAVLATALAEIGLSVECFSGRVRPGATSAGQPVISLGRITAASAYRLAETLTGASFEQPTRPTGRAPG